MPLFDYICENRHRSELLRPASVREVTCPQCGRPAARGEVNLVVMQMGADANWSPLVRDNARIRAPLEERPVRTRQFSEALEELHYTHTKAEESAQQRLPSTPLADIAFAQAKRLQKAGVTDSMDMPR